ncbi:MAG TPA: hypothetical protein PLN52_07900 [Opitutaceae bacterium]|nr:hypothetical protein [Opitutaceae bacterium]
MYPTEELVLLDRRKAILRARIRLQRIDTATHLVEVMRPVVWLADLRAKFKALPFGLRMLSGPLTFFLQRAVVRRLPVRGKMLLWIPAVWKVAKWVLPLMKRRAQTRPLPSVPTREAVKSVVKERRAETSRAKKVRSS